MAAKTKVRSKIGPESASRILRSVPPNKAFYFFTDIGEYSSELASNLTDFSKKIKKIDMKSVDFHFKRGDFEKWIRGTIGDVYLADEVKRIERSIQGEELREKISQTVESRLTELKKQLASVGSSVAGI